MPQLTVISKRGVSDLKIKDVVFFLDQEFFPLILERHAREPLRMTGSGVA